MHHFNISKASWLFFLPVGAGVVLALDNGLGQTPPMGWNSWNHFGCSIDEVLIEQVADSLVSTGLRDLGYQYLNLDDCWQRFRDLDTGKIIEDRDSFPSGMKALGDYIHSKGLKFGLYSDAGLFTCERRPGSLGNEVIDAQSYADFGADYLKYDNCFAFRLPSKYRYERMRVALNQTGRPIFYSLCNWGAENPATWAGPVGNSWRTTTDIRDNWKSVLNLLDINDAFYPYAGPGHWNDPDMLEVGNGGLTVQQERSHFTLWAIMKSPLLLGNDIANMTKTTIDILSNKKIIAINQDPLGAQAYSVWSSDADTKAQQVWAGPLTGGAFVVVLFNRADPSGDETAAGVTITAHWGDIPGMPRNGSMIVEDLWCSNNCTTTTATGGFSATVHSHDVGAFRMTPVTKSRKKDALVGDSMMMYFAPL